MTHNTKILVIADYPTKHEVSSPFSGAASMGMKQNLRDYCAASNYPLLTSNIEYTYLCPTRLQTRLDSDIFSKKEIPKETLHKFTKIEWLTDTYVSEYFHECLLILLEKIREFKPDIIVTSGKYAFYFLAGYIDTEEPVGRLSQVKSKANKPNTFGLCTKFRGSIMKPYLATDLPEAILIPIIPHAYQAQLSSKVAPQVDYARIASIYAGIAHNPATKQTYLSFKPKTYTLTEFKDVDAFLDRWLSVLDKTELTAVVDLETDAGCIDTFGIAFNSVEGFAIPLLKYKAEKTRRYKSTAYTGKGKEETVYFGSTVRTLERMYSFAEEAKIVYKIGQLLRHPNIRLVGHNFHYDGLYLKDCWGQEVHAYHDTMVMNFALNNVEKKNLAYLCSVRLDHYAYWKDDLKSTNSNKRWHYCAKDCIFTFGLLENSLGLLESRSEGTKSWYEYRQRVTGTNLLKRMFKGLAIDVEKRNQLFADFTDLRDSGLKQIQTIVGYPLNINSTNQIRALFLDCLKIDPIKHRKTGNPTFDNASMVKYCTRYPELEYLFQLIVEVKSINTYLNTFLKAKLTDNNELVSFIGVVGTKSGRFNSTTRLDGKGSNTMNWSTGGRHPLQIIFKEHEAFSADDSTEDLEDDSPEDDEDIALPVGFSQSKLTKAVPNSKQIVIPHRGRFLANRDLASGDLYVVAWMANAKWIKDCLLSGGDVYTELGSVYFGRRLTKSDYERDFFKRVCHATNYLGMPKTIAMNTGLDVKEVERIQYFYFDKNPEIVTNYQDKIINDCLNFGFTRGLFGLEYQCPTVDLSVDKTWQQKMCAVVAQGAVADWINLAIDNTDNGERELILPFSERGLRPMESKLQCHDAGLFEVDYLDKDWLDRLDSYFDISLPVDCIDGTTDILKIPSKASVSFSDYSICK